MIYLFERIFPTRTWSFCVKMNVRLVSESSFSMEQIQMLSLRYFFCNAVSFMMCFQKTFCALMQVSYLKCCFFNTISFPMCFQKTLYSLMQILPHSYFFCHAVSIMYFQKTFCALTQVSSLKSNWISKASALQRKGRSVVWVISLSVIFEAVTKTWCPIFCGSCW